MTAPLLRSVLALTSSVACPSYDSASVDSVPNERSCFTRPAASRDETRLPGRVETRLPGRESV